MKQFHKVVVRELVADEGTYRCADIHGLHMRQRLFRKGVLSEGSTWDRIGESRTPATMSWDQWPWARARRPFVFFVYFIYLSSAPHQSCLVCYVCQPCSHWWTTLDGQNSRRWQLWGALRWHSTLCRFRESEVISRDTECALYLV